MSWKVSDFMARKAEQINGFSEVLYKTIPINQKTEIRVLTSEPINENNDMLIDIRKYSLYGNTYDDIKRPTKRGIKFKLNNIPQIVDGLIGIMSKYGMIENIDADEVKAIMSHCQLK